MNKIAKMVSDLCPNGVVYRALSEILDYEQPGKYLVQSTNYNPKFPTPVLTAGKTFILGNSDETHNLYPASTNTPVIIFDDFTTAFKWVDFEFKAKSSAMKKLKIRPGVVANLRYMFYAMSCITYSPRDHARQWIGTYSHFEVPFPPIEIQDEVVRLLDNFTELEFELVAELGARKKQLDYYRNRLLDRDNVRSIRTARLSEVSSFGGKNVAPEKMPTDILLYSMPAFDRNRGPESTTPTAVKSPKTIIEKNCVLVAKLNPHIPRVWEVLKQTDSQFCSTEFVQIVPDESVLNLSYLKYFVRNSLDALAGTVTGGTNSHRRLQRKQFGNLEIPLPTLDVQIQTAAILNDMDSLVNDINFGIPVEIAARREQYEHYRDMLLAFPEVVA